MDHAGTIWRPTSAKACGIWRDVRKVVVRKAMKSRLIFDSAKSGLLPSEVPKRRPASYQVVPVV